MKKLFAILIFCVFSFVCFAQNNVAERIKDIRAVYAQAMENIKHGQEDDNLNNKATLVINENWPGSGPCEFTVEFFYTPDYSEEAGIIQDRKLFFIRVKERWAMTPSSKEYLVDPEDSSLMFFYSRNIADDGDGESEIREYFSKGDQQLIREIVDGKTFDSPQSDFYLFEIRHFEMLKNLFGYMPPYIEN